jgi:hypothetical protein
MQSRACAFFGAMVLVSTSVFAGGMTCERIEYAQLKDSSKKELSDFYCNATAKADLNKDLAAIERTRETAAADRTAREYGEAQVGCVRVADAASNMLLKKFGAKPPKACQ